MLLAGILSTTLNAMRRWPDVLDIFTTVLRNNKYANLPGTKSTDSGDVVAKQYRSVKVRLGDVQPDANVGHIAVATPSSDTLVNRLQRSRMYD